MIGLLGKGGKEIVHYEYDDFGNILSITGEEKDTIGKMNSFRYRSYYFDEESGFYYLQQRYYNPEFGRFINYDSILGANQDDLAYNIYTYCSNDPINNTDETGQSLWEHINRANSSCIPRSPKSNI